MWAHEEGGQAEHKAIEQGEIRRALSGAIADQELMLEQERTQLRPGARRPGPRNFARVTSRWIARRSRSRMS